MGLRSSFFRGRKRKSFLLQSCKSGFIVRLLGDLRDELGVEDLARFVDDDDGTCEEASERAVLLLDAVVLSQAIVTEGGDGDDLVQTFSAAEASLCEGQVLRDAEDDGVVELRSFGIEATHAGSADSGVDAGEDIEDDTLTTEVFEMELAQVGLDAAEVRSDGAYCREFATEVYGDAVLESDCCHWIELSLERPRGERVEYCLS